MQWTGATSQNEGLLSSVLFLFVFIVMIRHFTIKIKIALLKHSVKFPAFC